MRWTTSMALVLSCCGVAATAATPATGRPNLRSCTRYPPEADDADRQRTAPLAFPAAVAAIVATDRDHVAVSTLGGATQCIDARWREQVRDATLSADGHFFGYHWDGYEAFGYRMVDRAGRGMIWETGVKPVPSPSGRRMAAVEWRESGFGGLNAVLVVAVQPQGLQELARIEQVPQGVGDVRFDRWRGEDCFEFSGVRFADSNRGKAAPRRRFMTRRQGATWAIAPAPQGCPAA